MAESMTNLIWMVLFRSLQTALEALPTLLCGLLIAGLIRGAIRPETIRDWFTNDPRIGPVRAWFIGLLLPVCSFGVLPVAWELRRAGIPRASLLTLLLAAPLANPLTLVFAFQKLEVEGPIGLVALGSLLIGSFVLLVGLGVLAGYWFPDPISIPDLPPLPSSGLRRIYVVCMTAARGLTGKLQFFLILGVLGSGLLAIIPGGALERCVHDQSVTAPLSLAAVSIPFQTPPTQGMALICESLLSGRSIGRVFIIFALAIGFHVGTIAWIAVVFGFRRLLMTTIIVIGGSIAVGCALPLSLPNAVSNHSYFLEIESSGGYKVAKARAIRSTLTDDFGNPQWFLIAACAATGLLWLGGLVSSCVGKRGTISFAMAQGQLAPEGQPTTPWTKPLSVPQRTLTVMGLLVVGVVAGLYVYYPSPGELLNQLDGVQIEIGLITRSEPIQHQRATRLAIQLQRLQNKLVVADLLHTGSMDAPFRKSANDLRTAIERLKAAITNRSLIDELKPIINEVQIALLRCRQVLEQRQFSGHRSSSER